MKFFALVVAAVMVTVNAQKEKSDREWCLEDTKETFGEMDKNTDGVVS